MKPLLTVTSAALDRIKTLLAGRGKPSRGIRVGIKSRGCNGLAYTLEFVDVPAPGDDVIQDGDVSIFIDPKASLFIIGSEMDFVDTQVESGFVFRNPNEKGRCGCGESFHV